MARSQFQPEDDGRKFTYTNMARRRGGYYGPRRRWRRRRFPDEVYKVVLAALAVFGAFSLAGIFLVFLGSLIKR